MARAKPATGIIALCQYTASESLRQVNERWLASAKSAVKLLLAVHTFESRALTECRTSVRHSVAVACPQSGAQARV